MANRKKAPLPADTIRPALKKPQPIKGQLFYREDFGVFLREQFEGWTVEELAAEFDVPSEQVRKWISGEWGPDKQICRKLGLRVVYALEESPKRSADIPKNGRKAGSALPGIGAAGGRGISGGPKPAADLWSDLAMQCEASALKDPRTAGLWQKSPRLAPFGPSGE